MVFARRWLGWLVWVVAAAPLAAQEPLREELRDAGGRTVGEVSWPLRMVTARGKARLAPNRPTAFLERAARLDAYANLAAAARLVWVDRRRRVEQLAAAEPAVRDYLAAYVRYAEFSSVRRGPDGYAWIDARVPLFGVAEVDADGHLLGTELYRRDDVWAEEVAPGPPPNGRWSGVVLDARGLAAPGALAPTVRDEDGRLVWHVECADRELADLAGAVMYASDLDTVRDGGRAGDDPLVVKVVGVDGCDLVVSVADGDRIAPRAEPAQPAWAFALGRLIRTITPVSPFKRVCCVSTARPQP